MAGSQIGKGRVPRRGFIWLMAAVLTLALAGLGLEHTGSQPPVVNGVLSAHHSSAAAQTNASQANNTQGDNASQDNSKAPKEGKPGDDANHPDCDNDSPQDANANCGGQGHHKPPKCKDKDDHSNSHAQANQEKHEKCEISGGD